MKISGAEEEERETWKVGNQERKDGDWDKKLEKCSSDHEVVMVLRWGVRCFNDAISVLIHFCAIRIRSAAIPGKMVMSF